MRREKGFTLVELLVVVGILGVLAAVAIPQYLNYISHTKKLEAKALSRPVMERVVEYYNQRGLLPQDNTLLGLPSPESISGKYVESIRIDRGTIIASFREEMSRAKRRGSADVPEEFVLIPAVSKDYETGALLWLTLAEADEEHFSSAGLRLLGPVPETKNDEKESLRLKKKGTVE